MATPVIAVTSIATLVYVLATILPAIDRFCPYSTPVIVVFVDVATFFTVVAKADIFRTLRAITKTDILRTIQSVCVSLTEVLKYSDSFAQKSLAMMVVPMACYDGINPSCKVPVVILTVICSLVCLAPAILCHVIWLLRALPAILLLLPVSLLRQIIAANPIQLMLVSLVRSITIQLMLVSLVRSITIQYKLGGAYSGSTKVPMDLVTSQMLAWLIANCENSRSVDIALQAIAGADHDLPGEPLAACGALKLALLRLKACTKLGGTSLTALQYYRAFGVLVSGGIIQAAEDRWSRSLPHLNYWELPFFALRSLR
ncbi:hypothetical protein FRC09_010628 [Ceratobasidium sp. 395]|nr:hypothetical protein FRC09_010628 [Ceratobasidium sp. 395]